MPPTAAEDVEVTAEDQKNINLFDKKSSKLCDNVTFWQYENQAWIYFVGKVIVVWTWSDRFFFFAQTRFSKWNSQLDDLDIDIGMIKDKLKELEDASDEAELCLEENGLLKIQNGFAIFRSSTFINSKWTPTSFSK